MKFLRNNLRTLIKYAILGLVCLLLLLAFLTYSYLTRPQLCCSCLCQTSKGDWCSGSKSQGAAQEGCAKICQEACESSGCQLQEGTVINEGKCTGGLIPFL